MVHVDVDVAHGVGDEGGVKEEGLGGVGGGGVCVVDLDVVLRVVVEEVGVPGHWRISQYVALGDSGFGQRWEGFRQRLTYRHRCCLPRVLDRTVVCKAHPACGPNH